MLDLLRKVDIVNSLDAHIAKYFVNDAALEGLEKRLLPTSLFMVSVVTLAKDKMDRAMNERKYSRSCPSGEPMDTKKTFNDGSESPPNMSNFRSKEILRKKWFKRHLRHPGSNPRNKNVK